MNPFPTKYTRKNTFQFASKKLDWILRNIEGFAGFPDPQPIYPYLTNTDFFDRYGEYGVWAVVRDNTVIISGCSNLREFEKVVSDFEEGLRLWSIDFEVENKA